MIWIGCISFSDRDFGNKISVQHEYKDTCCRRLIAGRDTYIQTVNNHGHWYDNEILQISDSDQMYCTQFLFQNSALPRC